MSAPIIAPVTAPVTAPIINGHWTDPQRQRALPWRLRLPEQAAASAPGPTTTKAPLVLYSHGLGGNVDGGTVWARAWAQAGLAVLHLQHPGSDSTVLRGGLQGLRAAATAEQLMARGQDVRFVLDELARLAGDGEAPWAQLNLAAVGLAGHSFGAQTTQLIAGQSFTQPTQASDPRPRAFLALSPSLPRDGTAPEEAFAAVKRPFLAITGSEDGDPFDRFTGGEPRAQVYRALPPGQRALLWLDGADHMSFSGQNLPFTTTTGPFRRRGPAAQRQAVHHAVVARISTDWWLATLLGDAKANARLAAPEGLGAADRWPRG